MGQVGSTHKRIHGSGFMLHRRHRKLLIGELCISVLVKALVHRSIDLLTHIANQALPALTPGRRKPRDALLLQTFAELRLPPSLLAVALLPFAQFAVKRPIVLPGAGGEEVSNADINADNGSIWRGL